MRIVLWIVQALLALHTLTGAMWKLSNSEQAVPSLAAIPHSVWTALFFVEVLCSLGLVLPASKRFPPMLAVLAAAGIAAEMLLFCGVHLLSGDPSHGPMAYWLAVAAFCAFVIFGRFATTSRRRGS